METEQLNKKFTDLETSLNNKITDVETRLNEKITALEASSLSSKITALDTSLKNLLQPEKDVDKLATGGALKQEIDAVNKEIKELKSPLQDKAERDEIKNLIKNKKDLLNGNILLWNIFKYSALGLTVILSFAAFFVLTLDDKTSQASSLNSNTSQTPNTGNVNPPTPNSNNGNAPPTNINSNSNLNGNAQLTNTGNSQTPTPNNNSQTAIPNNNNFTFYKNLAAGISLFAALFALLHLSLVLGYRKNAEDAYKKINQLELLESKLTDSDVTPKAVRDEYNKMIAST